ncbi:hypothetical protein GWO53_09420 [Corynebacterium macginleyi]|uniref:Uncharacterized protein n=1 Tax=Corynebacterium macginleyi TaxID=38290 RepID=A0ABS1Y8J1_9CORY|nr:hypothetical protein [Corynebacterium macginleyi]MBK4140651.1 hypothetical protein [Corynebacterium macginleyi]MBK4144904.1 hypothetical protein [Corynebacterium macginleyi]MBK4152419.1 hypothetical protein [Corynebacterium macginleyi]MBK4156078.1 hypothetical protein [Corynebacterium macginleyi]MBK4160843.1 hypothetical protein [Corynebacterium macginleyi]
MADDESLLVAVWGSSDVGASLLASVTGALVNESGRAEIEGAGSSLWSAEHPANPRLTTAIELITQEVL